MEILLPGSLCCFSTQKLTPAPNLTICWDVDWLLDKCFELDVSPDVHLTALIAGATPPKTQPRLDWRGHTGPIVANSVRELGYKAQLAGRRNPLRRLYFIAIAPTGEGWSRVECRWLIPSSPYRVPTLVGLMERHQTREKHTWSERFNLSMNAFKIDLCQGRDKKVLHD